MIVTASNPIRNMAARGLALGHVMACKNRGGMGELWNYNWRGLYDYSIYCMPATDNASMRVTLGARAQEFKTRIEAAIQSTNIGVYADTGGTWTAGVATLTIGSNTVVTGDTVNVSGIVPSGFNGNFIVISQDTTHISYALAMNPGAWISGGVETSSTQWPPLATPGVPNAATEPYVDDVITDPLGTSYSVREWEIDDVRAIYAFTNVGTLVKQVGSVGQ